MPNAVIPVVLSLAALACAGFAGCSEATPRVVGVRPERRDLVSFLTTNGRLQASNQTAVHADVSGRLTELLVDKGDTVRAGEIMLRLADSGAAAIRAEARARLDAARAELADYERGPTPAERADLAAQLQSAGKERERIDAEIQRVTRLIEKQAAARRELDDLAAEAARGALEIDVLEAKLNGPVSIERREVLQAAVDQAAAALRQVDARAASFAVRAPRAGTVYSLELKPGDYVEPGRAIARIGSLEELRAVIYIDEPELGRVKKGSAATITADAYPGKSWQCEIERLATEIVELETRRVGEVSCVVGNSDGRLIPNLTVSVRIEAGRSQNALSVPREAVSRDEGKAFVWISDGGKAVRKAVSLGLQNPAFVEIIDGLAGAETVLLPGPATLTDGQPVSLLEETRR